MISQSYVANLASSRLSKVLQMTVRSCDLSQVEKTNTVVTSWATHKMTKRHYSTSIVQRYSVWQF